MQDERRRRIVTTRIVRPGDRAPHDPSERDEWADTTIDERIEAVWTLTLQCLAWNRDEDDEPRLQRSVVRIQRPGR